LPTLEVTSTTSQPTTTSTLHEFDYSRLVVQLAGCDDDYWGNAMVAGYVTNTGSETAEAFTVVAYLKTEEGEVVDGGVKEISLSNLAPGESKSFSAVYTKSPAWKKCQAKIKELEVAS